MRFLPLLGTAVALLGLFAVSEFAGRQGFASETTRRLVHIAGAGTTALFPFYLRLREVVVLAIAFTLFLGWTLSGAKTLSVGARTSRQGEAPTETPASAAVYSSRARAELLQAGRGLWKAQIVDGARRE